MPMPSHLQRAHLKWESWAQCRFKCWASVSSARPAAHEAAADAVAAEAVEAAEAAESLAAFLCLGLQDGLVLLERAETLPPRFRFPLGLEAAEPAAVNPQRRPRFEGGMLTNNQLVNVETWLCFAIFLSMWNHVFLLLLYSIWSFYHAYNSCWASAKQWSDMSSSMLL